MTGGVCCASVCTVGCLWPPHFMAGYECPLPCGHRLPWRLALPRQLRRPSPILHLQWLVFIFWWVCWRTKRFERLWRKLARRCLTPIRLVVCVCGCGWVTWWKMEYEIWVFFVCFLFIDWCQRLALCGCHQFYSDTWTESGTFHICLQFDLDLFPGLHEASGASRGGWTGGQCNHKNSTINIIKFGVGVKIILIF